MKKINEITKDLKTIDIICKLDNIVVSKKSNNDKYATLFLEDNTGKIEAKFWNINEEDIKQLSNGSFILIENATVTEFRNNLQLKIEKYKILTNNDLKDYNLKKEDLYTTAPIDAEKKYNEVIEIINKIKNPIYKKITLYILEKYKNQFTKFAGAVGVHHDVYSGLIWHSYSVFYNCLAIKDTYKYADINWELLACGAILHDIGKVGEIVDEDTIEYTLEGKMLGHISIGNAIIYKAANDLDIYRDENNNINKDVTLLQHMIIASHGKKDFGTPVEPNILEAVILSMIDDLDGRICKINDELSKTNEKKWTNRISYYENKMYYKHNEK